MEFVSCDLCGSNESKSLWNRGRFGMDVSTVVCEKCGLVYTNPRMTEKELTDFYKNEYRTLYNASGTPTDQFIALARRQAGDRLEYLLKYVDINKIHRALEIGCSVGMFLDLLQKHSVKTLGFEPTESHAQYAIDTFDLEVQKGFFDSSLIESGSMNLVCLFHVLEHLESPRSTLEDIHSLLVPNGLLYVEMPDIEQPYWGNLNLFFQNAHFYNFSVRTLSSYFLATGYEILNVARLVEGKFIRIIGQKITKRKVVVFTANPSVRIKRSLFVWRWKWMLWYGPKQTIIQTVRKAAKTILQWLGLFSKT